MSCYTDYDPALERLVEPSHDELLYCGRIDDMDRDRPVFVQPGSFVKFAFSGSSYVKAVVVNRRRWSDSWVGALVDDRQYRVRIERDGEPVALTLAEGLDAQLPHELTFFKRMDQCHEYTFLGFLLEHGARVEKARRLPRKKIEFYGDSVTAGEVAEATHYMRQLDPPHSGEYNNAYFSFAWATARRLHAQVHLVAQGGIALLDGTGYYETEDGAVGMERCYDRVYFYPARGRMEKWNFARFTPHVVVVAIGQNDSYPVDVMREEPGGARAQLWRDHYKAWICALREKYPEAWIVLTTTILYHHPGWDRSIGRVCAELNDPKIVHFLFEETGRGTPGHVRVPEAMNMALELSGFIEGLSPRIWE